MGADGGVELGADGAFKQYAGTDEGVKQNLEDDGGVKKNTEDDGGVERKTEDNGDVVRNTGVDERVERNTKDDEGVEKNTGDDGGVERNTEDGEGVERNTGDNGGVQRNMEDDGGVERNMEDDGEVESNTEDDGEVERNTEDDGGVDRNTEDDGGVDRNTEDDGRVERNMKDDRGVERNTKDDGGVERNTEDDGGVDRNTEDDGRVERNMKDNRGVERNTKNNGGVERNTEDDEGVERNTGDDEGVERNMEDGGVERNTEDDEGVERNTEDDGEVERNTEDDGGVDRNTEDDGGKGNMEDDGGVERNTKDDGNVVLDAGADKVKQDVEAAKDTAAPKEGPDLGEPSPPVTEPTEEEEIIESIPGNFYYDYESVCSQPYRSPDSGIPSHVLTVTHSFGYDCRKRANLHLLDNQTLLYVAGTMCVILSVKSQEQRYIRSSSGAGIGAVTVHPRRTHFAVAEKGDKPNILIYESPSLRPYRILRGGTEESYAFVDFNISGTLLASVGSSPDYTLTIWDWRQERIILRSKAFSQDVFQVTFSAENEAQLTTCGTGHIKFWKMASTFTGLKLQGELGRFGKTGLSDIEGYVELPDGKVISGCEWGNMLLWEGGLIKVELCRKGRRPCHNGTINQFVLDEGELITIGSDGSVRVWDFEMVDSADTVDDSGLLELEPMNELLVGKNVNLRFMVKTTDNESLLWFAQDSNGGIWKLDLSFTNITQDPECLYSFHSGNIRALDASPSTYLMATTSLDCSVRIYDYIGNYPLVEMNFKQGGTSLAWAPRMVNPKGGLFTVGFEDGVVRILEVHTTLGSRLVAGRTDKQDAEITLRQAFKPHTAPVTALAYERNGEILATGSTDQTVFLFAVGESYEPIGFIRVPGPVRELHWSPPSHEENCLLVLCENGFAVQIPAPPAEKRDPLSTFEIPDLPLQYFKFSSIKSKLEREEEIARRQKRKEEKQKEQEAWIKKQKEQGVELTEQELQGPADEEEEPLLPLYVPDEPSPILCGFYASPGKFWLSMDGYDSGLLYLCEFSHPQDEAGDIFSRRDEPLSVLPIDYTDNNPICKMHFSTNKQLLFCGMRNGAVRVYPLQANDPLLNSMHAYWSLGVHDNQYGSIQAICTSYDNLHLVTCGADSNIFTYSLLSMDEIEHDLKVQRAKIPSPRRGMVQTKIAEDIEDPNAYSIETSKQKRQRDLLVKQAEEQKARKRLEVAKLSKEFQLLLSRNAELPTHMQLSREEFEMDHRIREEMERQTSEKIRNVQKELAWEQEKHRLALKKIQARFRDNVEFDTVTIRAMNSNHEVSTYRLLTLPEKRFIIKGIGNKRRPTRPDLLLKEGELPKEFRDAGITETSSKGEMELEALMNQPKQRKHWAGKRLGAGRVERLKKITEKAEMAKSRISQRKQEWEELSHSVLHTIFNKGRPRMLNLAMKIVVLAALKKLYWEIKILEVSLGQAEQELEAFQREKQRKLNELHVVVPLKLHQVDYLVNGEIPGDLSQALVFTNRSLEGLQQRIGELELEKVEKRNVYKQAREQHKQLIRDKKEVERKIKNLQEKCNQRMISKFGRLVDLDALQTLSVNTTLEELKIQSTERAEIMDKELAEWEEKVTEMKRTLIEVTREQTQMLERMNELLTEKKALETKLDSLQNAVGKEFKGPGKGVVNEREKLLQLVQMQVEEISSLKEEISLLSRKGGSILPPAQPPIPHSRGTLV
ncbi:hypothetical protein GDO86_020595 [Hymenochirus boettgeri]|uniref:Cilia- and flagella-associated protein 44 n=1 Tax=Hymenochirus boettgeri TaxID=247094 RepID=A0A8T2IIQ0_9PIPI|nr:hypothetical protein GDO86_020595 [Hymenochirus boettgeri]